MFKSILRNEILKAYYIPQKEKKITLTNSPKNRWRWNMLSASFDHVSGDMLKHREIHKLDKISMVILPILFIVFNVAYWILYIL